MPDAFDLSGRRALVSGGGTGIGRAIAVGLAGAGAEVLLAGRRSVPLRETADALLADGLRARAEPCDVTDDGAVAELAGRVGDVDVLVNNAGISDHRVWTEVSREDWNQVLDLNLRAAFVLSQAFAPGMVERGWGRIVNVSSVYGTIVPDPSRYPGRANVDVPAYVASKAGLVGLTRQLAVSLAAAGITVNSISPGMFITEATRDLVTPEIHAALVERTPIRRLGRDADLSSVAVFLASDASAFVTGTNLVVDGGYSLW